MNDLVEEVAVDLIDHFEELNDNPDSQFGEYARVTASGGPGWSRITVLHEHRQEGVVIEVRPLHQ